MVFVFNSTLLIIGTDYTFRSLGVSTLNYFKQIAINKNICSPPSPTNDKIIKLNVMELK